MTWLHLVRKGDDPWVAALVAHQADGGVHRPTVVLLHEAAQSVAGQRTDGPRQGEQ